VSDPIDPLEQSVFDCRDHCATKTSGDRHELLAIVNERSP
jgi:hypothetical protein